ncbi:MAG: hypothetical protein K6E85_00565 [Lachnospiraceae bacterium]|nr:hypothetical protein [Lachnospiraceae bacterium]
MKSKISRLLSFVLALAMVLSITGGFMDAQSVYAKSKKKKTAPDPVTVYVTITDNTGKSVCTQSQIEVTDADGDGVLTINDALYLAHEKKYKGGAAAGYEYEDAAIYGFTGYSLKKLWGIENGGSYGYYKNSVAAMSLADPVEDGDFVDAYCYQDLKKWSDKYTFFNVRAIEVHRNEEFTLKLRYVAYNDDGAYAAKVKNAVILDNGEETEFKVNKRGNVKLSFSVLGKHYVSAASTRKKSVLVPPGCVVFVLPNKGNLITPDKTTGIKYKVIVSGSVMNNEMGEVEVYENKNNADVPETVEFGSVTYKVIK